MDRREAAIMKTLRIECGGDPEKVNGLVNNPADPGGITKYGISLRFLQHLTQTQADGFCSGDINHDGTIDANDIKALTLDETINILTTYFWNAIPLIDEFKWFKVAWKIFDFSVNSTPVNAVKMLQRSLGVLDDGVLGPVTLDAMNNFVGILPLAFRDLPTFQPIAERELLWRISREISFYYDSIVVRNEEQSTFLKGWSSRAFDLADDLPEEIQ